MKLFRTIAAVGVLALLANLAVAQSIDVRVEDGLNAAIDFANANPGAADTLFLVTDGGVYELAPPVIEVPMVIMPGPGVTTAPTIKAAGGIDQNDFIRVKEDLTVVGLTIDGQTVAGDYAKFKYMFKINNPPDDNPPNPAPSLTVLNCHLKNVYRNGDPVNDVDGNFFDIGRTSYAESVHFENTTLENSGDEAIRSINAHKDPVHPNNGAIGSLTVRNCTFVNINGTCIKIESDGDSTTVDGSVLLENLTFYKCQRRVIWERDHENTIIRNIIIANSKTGNDNFGGADVLISFQRRGSVVSHVDTFQVEHIVGEDTVRYANVRFFTKGGDWSGSHDTGDVEWTTIYDYDPMFADPENGDFTLLPGSKLYTLAHDGGALGDRRWATNPPPPPSMIMVKPEDGLNAAIDFANANPGAADIIMLTEEGAVYELAPVVTEQPMVIMGPEGSTNPPIIKAADGADYGNDFIRVKDDLTVKNVIIDGQTPSGAYATFKYMFKINNPPDDNPPNLAPRLWVVNCHLKNVYQEGDPSISENGSFFDIGRTSFAGALHFENTTLENSGDEAIRSINAHKDPVHPRNGAIGALIVRNCTFNNINGSSIKIESDGDSTTVDGNVLLENLTFYRCQRRVIWERDHENTQIRNLIIANSKTGNDEFGGSDVLISFQRRGSFVAHVDTFQIIGVKADGDTVTLGSDAFVTAGGDWSGSSDTGTIFTSTIFGFDPMFADAAAGDFSLLPGSPVATLAHDGGPLGDRRWAKNVTPVREDRVNVPRTFALEQNYPNPFNPATTLQYSLEKTSPVKLEIYNLLGELVETLVDEVQVAGKYAKVWDASRVASGVYLYRLQVGERTMTKKMMFLK